MGKSKDKQKKDKGKKKKKDKKKGKENRMRDLPEIADARRGLFDASGVDKELSLAQKRIRRGKKIGKARDLLREALNSDPDVHRAWRDVAALAMHDNRTLLSNREGRNQVAGAIVERLFELGKADDPATVGGLAA